MKELATIFVCIYGLAFGLSGCNEDHRFDPKFRVGEMVTSKLTGTSGMVVGINCQYEPGCVYAVRFPAKFSLVKMYAFELEHD